MNCKVCGGDTIVLGKDGPDRRRRCTGCGKRFTTTEVLKEEHQRIQEAAQAVREAAEKIKVAA